MAERAQQRVGSAVQGLETASIEPELQLKRTPTLHRDSTARPSPDLAHNLHLSVYSRLSANASSSAASAATTSTSTAGSPHAIKSAVYTTSDPELSFYGEGHEEEGENDGVLLVPRSVLDAEPTTSTTRSLSRDIRPVADSPPIKRESSPLVAVKTEAAYEDIQTAVDTSVEPESSIPVEPESTIPVQPEPGVHIERESAPLVAVKLEPYCQGSQPLVSLASTPAPPTHESVIVRTSPTCKERTDINRCHDIMSLLRCH